MTSLLSTSGAALMMGSAVLSAIPSGNVSVVATTPGAGAAPAAVWFESTAFTGLTSTTNDGTIYQAALHDWTVIWDFDDSSNATPSTTLNMPTAWKNVNTAYGHRVAHVFKDAGTYAVTVLAYDQNGNVATGSTSVTISDPDTTFATTQTIVVAKDSVFTGAPSGSTQVTSIAAAISARNTLGATDGRILLKRGETYTDLSDVGTGASWSNTISNFRLGAWGSGNKPILDYDEYSIDDVFALTNQFTGYEFVLDNLDIRGGWDSTLELGKGGTVLDMWLDSGYDSNGAYVLFNEVDADGITSFQSIIDVGIDPTTDIRICYNDGSIANWRNLGIFAHPFDDHDESYFAVIGTSVFQNVDALNGGSKSTGFTNDHGPIRIAAYGNVYLGVIDLFGRNGWSTASPDYADNAVLRLQTRCNSGANEGTTNFLDRCAVEGTVEIHREANGNDNLAVNTVIDKFLHVIGSRQIATPLYHGAGGVTYRNYLGVMLNVPDYHASNPNLFIGDDHYGTNTNNLASPIAVYNSTFLDLRSDTNADSNAFAVSDAFSAFTFTLNNNVSHAPNRSTPTNADAPIDTTTALSGFTPRYKGVRFNFEHETGTFGSDVTSPSGTFTIAYSAITEDLYGESGGAATTQGYWTALSENDHIINVNGTLYYRSQGDFSVSYDTSVVTITNTSGTTWSSGQTWYLRLDRNTLIPALDTTYRSDNQTVPTAQPTSGSAAIDDATSGLIAYDDLVTTARPSGGKDRGAYQAA